MTVDVAWWNLENLFDSETAPRDARLQSALRSELAGWSNAVRDRKLRRLASVIEQMFDGAGPDLLGVCEIENERVLELLADAINLPGRDYRVVTHDSTDARGIDVSFLVDDNVLEATDTDHQVVVKRSATRDIFWADITHRATGSVFVAVANHWPARSAGQYDSEPFRLLTGETVSDILDDLFEEFEIGNRIPIILMGDFNDEPFNRSMQEYLRGTRDAGRVRRSRSPVVYNLMWPAMTGPNPGSYRYGTEWNMLDQFLVTKGMLRTDSHVRVRAESVEIHRPANMVGRGGAPIRHGRPSRGLNPNGFSDHYPILVQLDVG
jgi:endonuclease/exonuclease/phosphatase family metal-dependent hydrolase